MRCYTSFGPVLLVLCSLICVSNILAQQPDPSTPVYYTADAALAYTWNRGYPQSCECAQSAVKKTTCDLFRCKCICDVTAGACDYNCCCDVDCSSDQKSRFDYLGACENEGFEVADVQHCYSSSDLYGVNPREPMGGQPTAHEAVGQALCVVQKNSAIPEAFFDAAEVVDSAVFGTSDGQKTYSYLQPADVAAVVDANYDQNDSIAAFSYLEPRGLVSNGPGFMQLPQSDFAGACNDLNYATFENRAAPQSCARTLSSDVDVFIAQCEQQFSLSRYVTSLLLAREADTLAANGRADLSQTLNVTLTSVFFEDHLTGSLTDITASWQANTCATQAFAGSPSLLDAGVTPDANCSFSDAVTQYALLGASAVCQGFVKAVYYHVSHDADTEAQIRRVNATVTLSDVPMQNVPAVVNGTFSSPVTLTQTFAVTFVSSDGTDVSSDNGNQIKRYRSGNPGYLLGMPILYGDLVSGVIQELTEGFTVPSSIAPYDADHPETFGLSACPQADSFSTATAVSAGSTVVRFGYDLTSGCSVQLNRSELIALCCAGSGSCFPESGASYSSPYSDSDTGIPYFYDLTRRYVGNYGDADPLDISQWTRLGYAVPADARAWNEKTATCSNMFNGMEIQFLVAATGSKSNPQNKIISSLAQITTGEWTMNIPANDAYSKQTFPMSITVSFVFQDEEASRDYIVPAPPVLFKVPYDVFYPFLGSAPPRYAQSALVFGSLSVSASVLVSAVCAVWLVM